jgi:hypothetical protein
MPLPSWKTYATITTPNGQTATAETPVCALTETQAATSVVTKLTADGYTTDGRVTVHPDGHCTHQH